MIVHLLCYGVTACGENGPPKDWPDDHQWSPDWADVTCEACIAGKEMVQTFAIAPDGKSITCFRCKRTSYNPNDVAHHYCGYCHVHHDDLWPPARKAWITMRYILCPKCKDKMQLHPEDKRMGFKQRRVEIPASTKPKDLHRTVTTFQEGHKFVEQTFVASLVCDSCNDPIPGDSPVTAVTLYQGQEPPRWEHTYGAK